MSERDKGPAHEAPPEEEITFDAAGDAQPEPELEFYVTTIEELRKERDEYYGLLQRKQAEFENFRKRVNREKAELRPQARGEVLRELLPVLDSAEKGLQSLLERKDGVDAEAFLEGFELLVKGLRQVLERFEVSEVPGVGSAFDPTLHEAVLREVDDGFEDGEILEEYRKGYQMNGRLLRPSQVKVAVHPTEASSSPEN